MRRAYSYIRFSKKTQAEGDSLRRQKGLSQAYCDRKGLQLDDGLCLQDLGVSAFRHKHAAVGALAGFLEAVRTGRVPKGSVLIIESLDRLSRSEIDEAYDLFRGLLKAGIDIVTLQPEREYTRKSLKSIADLFEPLFIMSRAHEESAMKSHRSRSAWEAKREQMPHRPASPVCPAWLRLKEDGTGFEPIPEAVAAVRRIYELARDGYGHIQITERLRQEGFAPFGGKRDHWCRQYVSLLLKTRAVLGEYQPHVIRDGKRVPEGKPVPKYFPPIMTEAEWYAARRAVESRRKQRGPRGERVRSLFTGIIFDARDGRSMVVKTKGHGRRTPYLVSSGAANGENDSPWIAIPYDRLESSVLAFLDKDLTAELLREGPTGHGQQIDRLTGELIDLDHRIQATQRRVEEGQGFEAFLDVLARLERKKRAKSAELEELRREQCNNHLETFGEARSFLKLLRSCPAAELTDLRTRLKARIRLLVEAVWVLIEGDRRRKKTTVQIYFRKGTYLRFTLEHPDPGRTFYAHGGSQDGLKAKDDLRQWRHLDEKPNFTPTYGTGIIFCGPLAFLNQDTAEHSSKK